MYLLFLHFLNAYFLFIDLGYCESNCAVVVFTHTYIYIYIYISVWFYLSDYVKTKRKNERSMQLRKCKFRMQQKKSTRRRITTISTHTHKWKSAHIWVEYPNANKTIVRGCFFFFVWYTLYVYSIVQIFILDIHT